MREVMSEASRFVLRGVEVGADAQIVCWPDRFGDARGRELFPKILDVLAQIEARECRRA